MKAIHRKRLLKLAAFLRGPVARAEKRTGKRKLIMLHFASHENIGLTKEAFNTSACALGWATKVFPRIFSLRGTQLYVNGEPGGTYASKDFFGLTAKQSVWAFGLEHHRTAIQEAAVLRALARS